MLLTKVNLLVIQFCCLILKSRGLERLAFAKDDVIAFTESALRNITNDLFIGFNFRGTKNNSKLRQSSLVHNFFTSVTLKDHKTLNEIVQLSRINKNNVNNETDSYVTLINEILNEDWYGEEEFDNFSQDEDIIQYIDEFLTNIDGFKENAGLHDKYESLEIKDELIRILLSRDDIKNLSLIDTSEEEVLSDNEFWVPEPHTRRIYQGDKTKIKYFPFMASIQIFNSFQCAGSIIKSDLIITAASCLQLAWNNRFFRENPAFLSIRVGSNFYNGGGENIPILEVYFHPDYNPRNLRHNLVICRLQRHLKFKKKRRRLKKIEIDTTAAPLPMNTDGITIVGWGARGVSNIVHDPWSNQLAFAVLDVYHLQECQEIYSREYVTRNHFCAGFVSKGGGACNHDVGGPGIVGGKLTGVVSFGSPVCGTPDAPTVFTKVGYYTDWIEEIMEQENVYAKRQTTLLPRPMPVTFSAQKTTFRITPIIGDPMAPPPSIQEIDATDTLRILEDEQLFKEFLATMFSSKEAHEYKDLLIDDPIKKSKNLKQVGKQDPAERQNSQEMLGLFPIEEQESVEAYDEENEYDKTITKPLGLDNEMESFERATRKPGQKYTMIDDNLLANDNELIESNIVKLIDNIDIEGNTEADSRGSNRDTEEVEATEVKDVYKPATVMPSERHSNLAESIIKKKDDPNVLTLLYISDSERGNSTSLDTIGNIIEDFDENFDNNGLAIPMEAFKDATFRNNNTSVLDFMSKSELYDLLSEAIDEVAKNKSAKLYSSIILIIYSINREILPKNI